MKPTSKYIEIATETPSTSHQFPTDFVPVGPNKLNIVSSTVERWLWVFSNVSSEKVGWRMCNTYQYYTHWYTDNTKFIFWHFLKWGNAWFFHYKPSISGYSHFWKPPCVISNRVKAWHKPGWPVHISILWWNSNLVRSLLVGDVPVSSRRFSSMQRTIYVSAMQ